MADLVGSGADDADEDKSKRAPPPRAESNDGFIKRLRLAKPPFFDKNGKLGFAAEDPDKPNNKSDILWDASRDSPPGFGVKVRDGRGLARSMRLQALGKPDQIRLRCRPRGGFLINRRALRIFHPLGISKRIHRVNADRSDPRMAPPQGALWGRPQMPGEPNARREEARDRWVRWGSPTFE